MPSGAEGQMHICCVIAKFHPSMILYVTISSIREGRSYDDACVLDGASSHSWLTHESYVTYRHIEQRTESSLRKMVESGIAIPKGNFDEAILQKILDGALISIHTKPFALDILK